MKTNLRSNATGVTATLKALRENNFPTIYPILKPETQIGVKIGALRQTLIHNTNKSKLILEFGYQSSDGLVSLTYPDLKKLKYKSVKKIIQQAHLNLANYETKLEFIPLKIGNRKILNGGGFDFSSEKMLCQNFMLKAHKMLCTEEILVSIPRRRSMLIIPKKTDDATLTQFVHFHNQTWKSDGYGNDRITNAVFLMKKGEILRTIAL